MNLIDKINQAAGAVRVDIYERQGNTDQTSEDAIQDTHKHITAFLLAFNPNYQEGQLIEIAHPAHDNLSFDVSETYRVVSVLNTVYVPVNIEEEIITQWGSMSVHVIVDFVADLDPRKEEIQNNEGEIKPFTFRHNNATA